MRDFAPRLREFTVTMVDTLEAVRDFHLEAMNEAIERMKPEMMAASEAAHRMKDHDDPSIKDLDRTVELGSLVADLVDLCAPHLHHIAKTLAAFEAGEVEGADESSHRH